MLFLPISDKILIRDTLNSLLLKLKAGARDHKEVTSMNKYELAVVLNVKLEDEERAAAIEKITNYITRFGGTVTNIDEWGKKRLAYEIQYYGTSYQIFMRKTRGIIDKESVIV